METLSWAIVSRSRTVTFLSSNESKSNVTQYGVPQASWRRYLLPIWPAVSKSHGNSFAKVSYNFNASSVNLLTNGNTATFLGAKYGFKCSTSLVVPSAKVSSS